MPDRNPKLGRLLIVLMLIIIILSFVGIVSTLVAVSYAQSGRKSSEAAKKTIESLKQSSARNECRTQLVNDDVRLNNLDTHSFQKDIVDILLSLGVDREAARQIAEKAEVRVKQSIDRPTAQEEINKQCPEGIVQTPQYTIPTAPTTTP